MPMITEIFPEEHWGKAFGIHDTAASLSIISIPIYVAIGLHVFPWRELFFFLCIASMLAMVLFWIVSREPRREKETGKVAFIKVLKKKSLWSLMPLWIFAAASAMGLYSILPLFLVKERGLSLSVANTVFGTSRLGGIAISIVAGFLVNAFLDVTTYGPIYHRGGNSHTILSSRGSPVLSGDFGPGILSRWPGCYL
jgi:NNP family nitrate/nitrite transporter-like MFS transporter